MVSQVSRSVLGLLKRKKNKLFNLAMITVPRTEGRSGTCVPSGDAAPGHETTVQNTQQVLSCQKMWRDSLRAEGVKWGV